MITIYITMPADSLSSDKYAVCSIDSLTADDLSSELSEAVISTGKESEYVDLKGRKVANGTLRTSPKVASPVLSPSPVPSTVISDKWVSYWTKRERCCCFCNFLLTVSLVVVVTIMVLVTKGVVDLNEGENDTSTSNQRLSMSSDETTTPTVRCLTPKPERQVCWKESCVRLSSELLARVNLSADPCQDFYEYACGGFVANTKLSRTSQRRRTNPDIVLQKYMDTLTDLLSEEAMTSDPSDVRAIKSIYSLCIENQRATQTQVKEVIDSLGGMEFYGNPLVRKQNFSNFLGNVMVNYDVSPLFKVIIQQHGKIGIVNRFSDELVEKWRSENNFNRYRFLRPSDYIYRNEETDQVLQAYKKYIGDFLFFAMKLEPRLRASKRFTSLVDDVFHMDIYVNRVLFTEDTANLSEEISKCERPMSFSDLQYHYNYNISWRELLTSILGDKTAANNYTICFVSLSTGLKDVLSGFSSVSLKRYIIFSALTQSDLFDFYPSATPNFDHVQWSDSAFTSSLTGQLYHVCIQRLSQYIPLTSLFRHRIPDAKSAAMRKLFTELNKSIENIIDNMYWVPITQKQNLLGALHSLSIRQLWRDQFDISPLLTTIGRRNGANNFFIMMKHLIRYRSENYYRGISHKSNIQSITELSGGILELYPALMETPLFYGTENAAAFYGATGTVMSQTISLTFDIDALLKFLTEGKIDNRVALTIALRLQCLVSEYNAYELGTKQVRGDLTKNANFKDSLALRVAYRAFDGRSTPREATVLPGLKLTEEQLFFTTYAQTMCEAVSKSGLEKYYINVEEPHISPGKYRVIGTLSNFKTFSDAFQCPKGSAMNPEKKCSLF